MANIPAIPVTLPAVRVDAAFPRGRRIFVSPDTLAFQQAAGNGDEVAVTFFPAAHIGDLASHLTTRLIDDRGRKHQAKSLAQCVGVRRGVVLVRAPYSDAAQAMRGARAFLSRRREPCHCLVAVSAAVFAKIEAQALSLKSDGGPSGLSPALQVLRESCAKLTIPAIVCDAFRGNSVHADWVRRLIMLAAASDKPVLILGESGTGKEKVARQIHDNSARRAETFHALNCAAIPEHLLESELFGHVKGAFTGAVCNKPGAWKIASRGTLFLDEVGDLSLLHQAKILRVLDAEGSFRPVGGTEKDEEQSNARVLAATNRDLSLMIRSGAFREDLYFRLFSFRIRTPALSAHPDDIPELAQFYWRQKLKCAAPLPASVANLLASLPWPGNVRELNSFLNHLHIYANHNPVTFRLAVAVLEECRGHLPPTDR